MAEYNAVVFQIKKGETAKLSNEGARVIEGRVVYFQCTADSTAAALSSCAPQQGWLNIGGYVVAV